MSCTAYHVLNLVIFLGLVAFAGISLRNLRITSALYNPKLVRFANFSFGSWILWALQYILLFAGPAISLSNAYFQSTGLLLGVMHNTLWASAVLSLSSKVFPRISVTLPVLLMFSGVTALAAYRTTILTSGMFIQIDAVSAATIFLSFAFFVMQLRPSKKLAVAFFIHGYFQWIWRWVWFSPAAETQIVQLAFPLWHIILLLAWITFVKGLSVPVRVMISSTFEGLTQERDAVERALNELRVDKFRAESFGSLPETPVAVCKQWAEQCDIFVLIIGERYGSIIESERISFIEFEYNSAHAEDSGKILVYVKNDVNRELRLEKFLSRLQDPENGHVTSSFTKPNELSEKIQHDVKGWLISHGEAKILKRRAGSSSTLTPS